VPGQQAPQDGPFDRADLVGHGGYLRGPFPNPLEQRDQGCHQSGGTYDERAALGLAWIDRDNRDPAIKDEELHGDIRRGAHLGVCLPAQFFDIPYADGIAVNSV
jgi:hypothetical protein